MRHMINPLKKIKREIDKASVLKYVEVGLPRTIQADASENGVGAVFMHREQAAYRICFKGDVTSRTAGVRHE